MTTTVSTRDREKARERGRESPCVLTLDRRSAPRIIQSGEDFLRVKMPEGTRVIYPPEPLAPVPNAEAAIRHALNHPEGCEPLHAKLRPGMKVTIAVDDLSLPLPPMRAPDVRQQVLEVVLQMLAQHGVDDVEVIIAVALHRHMTADEIRHAVGPKVFRELYPKRLYNHDAEDPKGMKKIGEGAHGEPVIINRRAAESDLLIYVNLNLVPMDGGHKSVGVGLTNYEGLKPHHNPDMMLECWSYMDPAKSGMHRSCERIGRVVNQALDVFHIETTINNHMYGDALGFLAKREEDFSTYDEWAFWGIQRALERLPRAAKRAFFHAYRAPFGLTGVTAGKTDPVHAKTLERCFKQYAIPVRGQCDVLVSGVPYLSPYNVNSILNPLLVQVMANGYWFNMYRGVPIIRQGGVQIICHPLYDDFHPQHHPSYIEFFHRLLPETHDSRRLRHHHEEAFARDPAYIHLYRNEYAYHGAHPFYMWYWGEQGRKHIGKTIVVGCESPRAAEILGWETAESVDDALAMAASHLGKPSPEVTLMHWPPLFITDVTA